MEDELLLELVFLRYFFDNADFGPADQDVREQIYREFESTTGYDVPEGYKED